MNAADALIRLLAPDLDWLFSHLNWLHGRTIRLTSFHGPCFTEGVLRAVRCSATLAYILTLTLTLTSTLNLTLTLASCIARYKFL